MRRSAMYRTLVVISAILCALAALMWLRSTFTEDALTFAVANRRFHIGSSGQRLWLSAQLSLEQSLVVDPLASQATTPVLAWRQLLPAYEMQLLSRTLLIPYWMILLAGAVLPWHAWRRPRRRRGRPVPYRRARKATSRKYS